MIVENVKKVGNLSDAKTQSRTVYDADGISPTLCSGMDHGNTMPHIIDKQIVAMRGRNPDNPSDRTVGSPTEQRLEPNSQGICNTLTSVQKDNMVLEVVRIGGIYDGEKKHQMGSVYDKNGLSPTIDTCTGGNRQPIIMESKVSALDEQNMTIRNETFGTLTTDGSSPKHNNRVVETVKIKQATQIGFIECEVGGVADLSYPTSTTRRGRVQDMGRVSPTITATETGVCRIESEYRIRKLTENECWRIMNFSDCDFLKASKVNSRTQLYKQAGNSIVRNVLVAIFGQMLPGKENVYKEI